MKKLVTTVFVFLLVLSCVPDLGGTDDGPLPENQDIYTLMTNGSDPQLLKIEKQNDTTIAVYGDRDANGIPTKITGFTIGNGTEDEQFFELDENSRIAFMRASNGVQFSLNWKSETVFDLTATSADGITTINTEVDLLAEGGKINKNSYAQPTNNMASDRFPVTTNKGPNSVTLEIYECNTLSSKSYRPKMIVREESVGNGTGDFLRTLYPKEISSGVFESKIPNDLAPVVEPDKLCDTMNDLLYVPCLVYGSGLGFGVNEFMKGLCLAMAAKITALGITAPLASPFFIACSGLTTSLFIYCNTVGASPPEGGSSLANKLCAADLLNVSIYQDIVIYASLPALPNNILSNFTTNPGQGPYKDLLIDLGNDNCTIRVVGNLGFGETVVGETGQRQLTITNQLPSAATVTITGLPDGFETDWTSQVLTTGETRNLTFFFRPEAFQNYTGSIVVENDIAGVGNSTVALSGIGVLKRFDLEGDLDFGSVEVNRQGQRLLKISNPNATVPITISSITYPEDGFALGWTAGEIAPGATRDIIVDFLPTETRQYAGTVQINSDADPFNNSLPITGTGVERPMELLGSLSFGDKSIGSATSEFFTIVNNSADTDIQISTIDFDTPTGIFTVRGWSNGTVTAGTSREVEVVFSPQEEQSYSGNLTVVNNIDNDNNTIPISGTGIKNTIRLVGDLDFGAVSIGESTTKTIQIENPNLNEPIEVQNILLPPEGFTVNWNGGTIPTGVSQPVVVTFTPTNEQSYAGIFTVVNNVDDQNNTLAIAAMGTPASPTGLPGVWLADVVVVDCTASPVSNDQLCANHVQNREYVFMLDENRNCGLPQCGEMDFARLRIGNSDRETSNLWEFDGTTLNIELTSRSTSGFFFDTRTFSFTGTISQDGTSFNGTYTMATSGGLWRNSSSGTMSLTRQ